MSTFKSYRNSPNHKWEIPNDKRNGGKLDLELLLIYNLGIYVYNLGGYCVCYPSNMFRDTCSFENLGISLGYNPVLVGNIQSCDAFRPNMFEGKY